MKRILSVLLIFATLPVFGQSLRETVDNQKAQAKRGINYETVEMLADEREIMHKLDKLNPRLNGTPTVTTTMDKLTDILMVKAACQGFIMGVVEALKSDSKYDETSTAASKLSPVELEYAVRMLVGQHPEKKDDPAGKYLADYLFYRGVELREAAAKGK